jgi:hypothetical protein
MTSLGSHPRGLLCKAARKKWVVFSKPPLAGPEQVLKYLGRYTYRIAISNGRLISMKDGKVSFRWKDRAHGDKEKTLTLEAGEFMRRFLLHVIPEGLMRIRHYGLFSNTSKHKLIARCKELLGIEATVTTEEGNDQVTSQEMLSRLTGWDVNLCPQCRTGHLIFKEKLPSLPLRSLLQPVGRAP